MLRQLFMSHRPDHHEPPPPAAVDPPPPSRDDEEESVKQKLDKAGKAAKGTWGVLKAIIKPLLPKKWTGRNIAIAVIVVLLAVVLLWFILNALMGILQWAIVIALVVAGLYLLFGPRK